MRRLSFALGVAVMAALPAGCVLAPLIASPAGLSVLSASLGFGAAALTFDAEALTFWNTRHPEKP
jgi:hypothetical protein